MPAGVGLATARAAIKLWCGVNPRRSGVFSAGNGPAMRSAIIGAYYADDAERRAAFVEASTALTHTDPKALVGAMAIAELAADPWVDDGEIVPMLCKLGCGDEEWEGLLEQMLASENVDGFVEAIGSGEGVSGYVYRTVPVAIFAWLTHRGNGTEVVEAVLDCGGDTDTVGAIAGALCGASHGVESFRKEWLDQLMEWPRGIGFIERLARCPRKIPKVFWGWLLLRNVCFLLVVIAHAGLRCLPGGLRLVR